MAYMDGQQMVWVVGDWRREEFADAIGWLKRTARCHFFTQMDFASIRGDSGPVAILTVQSRPGQFSPRAVERLHAAAPLARLVALAGAWCEGEERSGRPSPGVVRVPIGSWQCRLGRELGLPVNALAMRLPRTATASERVEAELRAGLFPSRVWQRNECDERGVQQRLAAVYTSSKSSFDAISDLLRQIGIEASWSEAKSEVPATVSLVLIDGWAQASALAPAAGDKSIARMLLLHFPREEDIERAKMHGIDAVLPLPLSLTDLATLVTRIRSSAAEPLACASGLCNVGR
jgi:hypothetical protein